MLSEQTLPVDVKQRPPKPLIHQLCINPYFTVTAIKGLPVRADLKARRSCSRRAAAKSSRRDRASQHPMLAALEAPG